MSDDTIITPEGKELLGVKVGSYTGEVEKVMVRRYAEAIGDANAFILLILPLNLSGLVCHPWPWRPGKKSQRNR